MQTQSHAALRPRLLYYWAKLYAGQLKRGAHLTLHLLELPRLPERSQTSVVHWARFLRASSTEDWRTLMSDPDMARAKLALEELSQSEEAQWIAEARELALSHHASLMHDALTEGEAKGRAEGEAKGRAEGKAEAIEVLLEARGLSLTEEDRTRLRACHDLAQLDRWLRRSVAAESARDLFVSD